MELNERERIIILAQKAKRWIESERGQREIKKALQWAKKLAAQFKEASKVDSKSLHRNQ